MLVDFPKFPGAMKNRTPTELARYVRTITDAGYDPVAIGAVIELESARSWSPAIAGPAGTFSEPPGYPVGLIQFAPSTARKLGTSSAALKAMSFHEQVKYLPKYYALFGPPSKFKRPVDYYLAGWGDGVGTSDDYVLARRGDLKFTANSALARGDDVITTGDLRAYVDGKIAEAERAGKLQFDTFREPPFAGIGPVPGQPAIGGVVAVGGILGLVAWVRGLFGG